MVAEALAQRGAAAESVGMLADDVAGEIEMLRHPVTHRGKVLAEGQGNNVFRIAHENGAVAHVRVLLDVADHLGVIVAGEKRLVLAA